ncbi:DUF4834 family protein [Nonlabens ponticola]|uniref:DUF4834 family protein n=1 Tax=Nonlabens ponticola TaxID=2496866 RepID=A0A3S9MYK3_9FLAO|nr:DUF4834 family protein [Nonlabens ponticola]AZQ44237.1 DUF4834 family protein [Nonlabens ponticola]
MKLLQAVLIILLVYMTVRIVVKYFGKSILRWAGAKAMERVQRNFNQENSTSAKRSTVAEGEVKVERKSTTQRARSNPNKTVGEYVDYEEID